MRAALARVAYSLLLRLATPAYLARLWWRGRVEPPYRLWWGERLGFSAEPASHGRLWLHAVSLGETRAAAPLIAALRARRPGLRLLLTHGTATGRDAGRPMEGEQKKVVASVAFDADKLEALEGENRSKIVNAALEITLPVLEGNEDEARQNLENFINERK